MTSSEKKKGKERCIEDTKILSFMLFVQEADR